MVSNELIIQEPNGGSLRDFLSILFKRKTAILTIFLAVVFTVTVGSFLMSSTYPNFRDSDDRKANFG
ncbi:MAG: hypothetical protein IMZ50_13255 [Candidatus Atribacteria bacterium]|nr:hypothetical protein [Candidatus Atribacteria bacterium]